MNNHAFKALTNLAGYYCTFEHGVTTFENCTINTHAGSDMVAIRKDDRLIQHITKNSFFSLMICGDMIKVVFIA